jgi:hypothetical protein
VLELCGAISDREPAAATALERWEGWQEAIAAGCSRAESRFQRRAYERARETAMAVLVMELARARRRPSHRGAPAPRRGPGTRLRRRAGRVD